MRLMVVRTSFDAPSLDGKASTRLDEPLRQSGGATAAATPGAARSLATIGSRLAPGPARTSQGLITPAETPRAVSARPPRMAVPVAGEAYGCAPRGFDWH